jgi:LPXTG-motif cell wall-anchored protein
LTLAQQIIVSSYQLQATLARARGDTAAANQFDALAKQFESAAASGHLAAATDPLTGGVTYTIVDNPGDTPPSASDTAADGPTHVVGALPSAGTVNWMLVAGVVLAVGALVYFLRKR